MLEAQWPAQSSSSQLLWNKLRYVVLGAAHFRWAARRQAARKLSASTEGGKVKLEMVYYLTHKFFFKFLLGRNPVLNYFYHN